MSKFKMSIIQNKVLRDKKYNLLRAKELILSTISLNKPDIIVLPEFFNTPLMPNGNPIEYAEYRDDSETIRMISSISKDNNVHIIGGSIPIKEKDSNKVFNTCFCYNNKGEITATYRKMHMFDVDIPGKVTYKESDKVSPGDKTDFLTVFNTPFAKFGIGICYDIRFYEHSHLLKAKHNIDCMVYPSAFSLPTGLMHWDLLRRMRALDNNVYVAMASPSRNYEDESYWQVYGYSSIISPYGEVLNSASYEEGIVTSTIDLSLNDQIKNQIPTWKHKRNELYEIISKV